METRAETWAKVQEGKRFHQNDLLFLQCRIEIWEAVSYYWWPKKLQSICVVCFIIHCELMWTEFLIPISCSGKLKFMVFLILKILTWFSKIKSDFWIINNQHENLDIWILLLHIFLFQTWPIYSSIGRYRFCSIFLGQNVWVQWPVISRLMREDRF